MRLKNARARLTGAGQRTQRQVLQTVFSNGAGLQFPLPLQRTSLVGGGTIPPHGAPRRRQSCACCAGRRQGGDRPDTWGFGFNRALRRHTAPHIFQACDRRIVHRSNALLGHSYGDGFSFEEVADASGRLTAVAATLGVAALGLLLALKPIHPLLRRMLPKPGEGAGAAFRLLLTPVVDTVQPVNVADPCCAAWPLVHRCQQASTR